MNLGNKLTQLRKEKHLSQKELSILLNISTGTVGMWETDKRKPDLEMVLKIADFYNISLDSLFEREETTPSSTFTKPLSEADEKILTLYRKLNTVNKDIILGEIQKLLKEQIRDARLEELALKKAE